MAWGFSVLYLLLSVKESRLFTSTKEEKDFAVIKTDFGYVPNPSNGC
jgi:hypothetical protein